MTRGFSMIEMVTVVALMAIIVGAAYPTAAFLFSRYREDALKENLTTLRLAVSQFRHNRVDDDKDGRIDEDPRGDANLDGFPGIRHTDDDGDLLVDEDWGGRTAYLPEGKPNADYDWRARGDDDEDGVVDEEAFPGDLNELASKMEILRNEIPEDPTTGQSAWGVIKLDLNNDFDYYRAASAGERFRPGEDPVVRSLDGTYHTTSSRVLFPGKPPVTMNEGDPLQVLRDEDPRNGIDDDLDGLTDEDAPDVADIRSLNSTLSAASTPYSSW